MRSLLVLALLFISAATLYASEPDDLVPLQRFYKRATHEHVYSVGEKEQAKWRQSGNYDEQVIVGLIATKNLPGTVRLYRHLRPDGRHVYSKDLPINSRLAKVDNANFEAYVWTEPGEGRIGVYCSTWLDGSDVYLETGLQYLEKFSADSKRDLGVDRLRPTLEPLFYVYSQPMANAVEHKVAESDHATAAKTEAAVVVDDKIVRFEPLELHSPATSFDMTEDGKFILISHQAENLISVFDVLAGRVIDTISSDSPRSIICRGDRVFVANFGKGTISVFSRSKNWKLIDELLTEKLNVVHIAAGQGKGFAEQLIVTCHGQGVEASYKDSYAYVIDVRQDRSQPLGRPALASVSADGKLLITQESFNLSPSGSVSAHNYLEFTKSNAKPEPIYRGGIGQTPYIYQVFPGSYWFSQNIILGGVPLQQLGKEFGRLIIPDHSQQLFYALDENIIRAHRLTTSFTELEMRRIQFPDEYQEIDKICQHLYRMRGYCLDHPMAYTHGERLHMFVLTAEGGAILAAETAAFESPKASTTEGSTEVPQLEVSSATSEKTEAARIDKPPVDAHSPLELETQLQMGFPELISAGKEFRYQWKLPQAKFELMSDLHALTVTPQGALQWRVTDEMIGSHTIKLRVSMGGENTIVRLATEVVDSQLFASIDGDQSKLDRLHRVPLEIDNYTITPTANNAKLLLLQGDQLNILPASGRSIERKFTLPKRYGLLKDRNEYLVAVGRDNGLTLDLINKKTMKVQRSIGLKLAGVNIAEVSDLALHPLHPTTFVAVENQNQMPKYSVLKIDENSGEVTPMEVFGKWIQVSPDGKRIYSGYKDIYIRGSSFHLNPGWQLIEIPDYGPIDMLLSWDLRDQGKLRQVNAAPGDNGFGLRMSPDGNRIVYLSFTGDAQFNGDLVGWNTEDFKENLVRYETRGKGSTTELAFHPTLPWLAVPSENSALIYHLETGEILNNKLLITAAGLNGDKLEKLEFSPDGKNLLFVCSAESGRYLRAVELKLTPEERTAKRRMPRPTPNSSPNKPKRAAVAVRELDALYVKPRNATLTAKEIGRRYLDAVVSIVAEDGFGSGFFIGKSGYLLTSAHVIDGSDEITVIYNGQPGGKEFVKTQAQAELIHADERLDIALLKIATTRPLPFVALADGTPIETGESVIVIGSPGLGAAMLSRTMTSGIVSNPDRVINGLNYIQTSAAINPGNSGGAMFDSRGRVIGIIELKGETEGTGFAIPAGTIRAFLQQATSTK